VKKLLSLVACLSFFGPLNAAPAAAPNVLVILVDDMGFSDIAPYGGEIDTPNLAALAANGLRFTQFSNAARCCPTRAALLTGLHPHQTGIGHMVKEKASAKDASPDAYRGNLNDSCLTLAQVAKSRNYATYMTGKWHVAGDDRADWPLQRGFDRYYGNLHGAVHQFAPYGERVMYDGNTPDPTPKSTTNRSFYTTDAFADHAIGFLNDHFAKTKENKSAQPFFLYVAFTAPHWPLHAHDEELAKYRDKYLMGWDKLREQRFARQQESGLIPRSWKLSPRDPDVPAWDSLSKEKQQQSANLMSAYAAVIDRLDQNIGHLFQTIKKHDEWNNTLVLFLSDNGACAEGSVTGLGDPVKDRSPLTALQRPSYGKAWANVSSTPYRLFKSFAHEGGSNTPFIAHWPDRIKKHDWYREPAHLIDIMPTLLEITGATYPAEYRGKKLTELEGVSLTPSFEGNPLQRRQPLCIEHQNNAYLRDGIWKLVGTRVSTAGGTQRNQWELYRMDEDGTELHDLAATQPEKLKALADQWEAWAKRVGVYPKK
jgi:arylsulfatase A-like enzyme